MDFRWRPDRSEFEATAGNAQFGLAFDDFGNRFLCSNRQHIAHVVLPDRYLKRNPFLGVAKTVLDIPNHGAAARIFPLAATRTTAVEHAGTFTAACGLVIYRGTALPEEYHGNSFICDPTGYLVHRDVLVPNGPTFIATRAPQEARREFLASTDEWFRPVNLANGPDGALYIVDMYRETIEHPQYMPKGLAEKLDLRRGEDRGRIYRIASNRPRRTRGPWPGELSTKKLVDALDRSDAWWRETAQRLLVERQDPDAIEFLEEVAQTAAQPVTRIHALWTLEGLGSLFNSKSKLVARAMTESNPLVREQAIRLAELGLREGRTSIALEDMADDPDRKVRFQFALAMGEIRLTNDKPIGAQARIKALAKIAQRDVEDPWTQIAVLSSAAEAAWDVWQAMDPDFTREPTAAKVAFLGKLASVIGARRDKSELDAFLLTYATQREPTTEWWQLAALSGLAEGLRPSGTTLAKLLAGVGDELKPAVRRVEQLLALANETARDTRRAVPERTAAILLMSHSPFAAVGPAFPELLAIHQPQEVQLAAVRALGSMTEPGIGPLLLSSWSSHSPPIST